MKQKSEGVQVPKRETRGFPKIHPKIPQNSPKFTPKFTPFTGLVKSSCYSRGLGAGGYRGASFPKSFLEEVILCMDITKPPRKIWARRAPSRNRRFCPISSAFWAKIAIFDYDFRLKSVKITKIIILNF